MSYINSCTTNKTKTEIKHDSMNGLIDPTVVFCWLCLLMQLQGLWRIQDTLLISIPDMRLCSDKQTDRSVLLLTENLTLS